MNIYIVYKTTNLINGKFYIGKHKQSCLEFDGYLGSGSILKLAIEKYGKENFVRETLAVFENEADAFQFESQIVNEMFVNKTETYNLSTGGTGGRTHHHQTKKKLSRAGKVRPAWNKGKQMWNEEDRKRISEQNKSRPPQSAETIAKRTEKNKGKKRSEESKAKTSKALKGRIFSDETRKKMSESAKKRRRNYNS
jgi:group I intron endonuclease